MNEYHWYNRDANYGIDIEKGISELQYYIPLRDKKYKKNVASVIIIWKWLISKLKTEIEILFCKFYYL